MSFDLTNLSNADLEALHKSLHVDVSDPVKVQAHHLVTTELLVRGLDHGHNSDEWNRAVIEIGVENDVPVNKAFDGIPSDVVDTVNVELGYPESVSKTTILTVDGYTLKFDTVKKDGEPEDRLNPTQSAVYDFLESLTETVGKFNQSSDANGAHYMEENPFVDEGLMCANCVFFQGGGGCEIVEGQIDHMALCKFWIIPENLLGGMSKHLQGQHNQSTHGDWAHGSSVSGSDFQAITKILSKKNVRLSYNDGYDSGRELKRSNSNPFTIPAVMKRHEELHSLLDEFRKGSDLLTNGVYADHIVTDAGFFDALNGSKRRFRRLLVDPIPQLSTIPLLKHGHHDQKTHGNWAHGGAGSSFDPLTHDWGYGSDRPEVQNKPNEIHIGKDTYDKSMSIWHYMMPDGRGGYILTPERQKLHAQLIADALKGVPKSSDPTFIMMGGGGGSGKGHIQSDEKTIAEAKKYGITLPPDDPTDKSILRIDADAIKASLPDFAVFINNNSKTPSANWVHEESSILAKEFQKAGFKAGVDVFLDGTGNSDASKLRHKIQEGRSAGYKVQGCYVTASIDLAWQQNMRRADTKKTRGLVPPAGFLNAHKSVSAIIPQMATEFDNFILFDTNHDTRPKGSTPPLVAHAKRNGTLSIVNSDLWNTFVNKASDRTTIAELEKRWAEYPRTYEGGK